MNGTIIGVLSGTFNGGCARGTPDIYTNVYYFLDWIERCMKYEETESKNSNFPQGYPVYKDGLVEGRDFVRVIDKYGQVFRIPIYKPQRILYRD